MKFNCRYIITLNQLIGIILASIGFGMLIVTLIPWWSFIIAIVIIVLGLLLIFS